MLSSSPRDNWERLVAAVLKKDEIWQLCHQDSITTVSSDSHRPSNSNSSGEILSRSSSRSSRISLSSPRQTLLTGAEATKNTFGIQKIFSALLGRRKPKGYDLGQGLAGLPEDNFGLQSFSLRELHAATDNFSNTNVLRNEGHSSVYKGRLADGSLVAVKRFTRKLKEMEKELEIASIAAHHNVIRALGFCITEKEWLLVYAYTYMVNGSVAYCLRERQEPLPPLDWPARKWIAVGAAKGLAYLHYNCPRKIIHRDVKAANILLDEDLEAVVCNFNLAEFVDCYEDDGVRGTIGHIAPEYLATGKCSVKNDVFGYGVFLLELITAQKSFDLARVANDNNDMMLLNLVKESCKERKWKEVVDAELRSDLVAEEVETLLQIALICTQTDPEGRPTMVEVVRMLRVGYGCAGRWEKWDEEGFDVENLELGNLRRFTIHELQVATKDFSIKVISKDGFNMIYKGWLDGSPVAVKRYISQSLEYYFEKELDIGKLCLHPNIVQVIGCCKTPEEQLLVFRFMVNGSVESWLKGRDESRPSLTWQKRRKIALGAARGLAFLHDKPGKKIINRDVKASNILLDDNFEAVVADFKLAKLIKYNTSHVTTIVTGTIGHIAPEYLASGKCSDKTDVFGYGAFLLELVTGQRIIDFLEVVDEKDMFCADWVKRNYKKRRWELVADKDSEDDFMEAVVKKLVQISVLCTQYDPDKRPRMSDVVRMLEVGDVLAERSEERSKKEVGEEGGPLKNYLDAEPIEDDDSLACNPDDHFGFASYSLCELHDATDGFSKKNVIGHGGHSTVYKGRLGDGSLVAVKRLRQQVIGIELEIANHLAHCNVVLLCGFCITQTEQLLVYPYMANGSVASCLRERPETQPPLNLAVRQKIALGVAKGLAYLHHECNRVIIHRDIKAANILLDEDFEAVVADFTLAKFTDCYDDDIVTAVRGTIGHIAPEYLSTSKLSVKSDVFSYGVFLLELVTGNRAVDLARLANQDGMWVKKLCKEKRIEVMVDLDLRGNFEVKEVEKLLQIALICRQSDPKERPSMLEVVRMLEYEDIFNLDSRWERLLNNESEPSSSEWTITVTDNLSFTAAEELSGPR